MSINEVDDYLAELDEPKRSALERLRQAIAAVIPEAEQGLSYGVPVFRIGGNQSLDSPQQRTGSATSPTAATSSRALPRKTSQASAPQRGQSRFPSTGPYPTT